MTRIGTEYSFPACTKTMEPFEPLGQQAKVGEKCGFFNLLLW